VRIGLYVSVDATTTVDAAVERVAEAERRGFQTAWLGQLFDHDALTLLALASRGTERIELGTWVVPIQPRHPSVLAQQALTVQGASAGRLVLGVGVSHEAVVAKRLGLSYAKPLRQMREYLDALLPLLAGEEARVEGETVRATLRLGTFGAAAPPVLVAALGPRMLELAGERADGAALWLGGPRYLEEFAIPRVREAAQRAGRPTPRIACGFAVALASNRERARAAAEAFLARSSRLPAYRRVLDREGAASPGELAVVGDENELEGALTRLAGMGVTDFTAVAIPIEGEDGARERTREFLGELARRGVGD
jgi:F420-dependent oxidoreductase-like protein